MAIMAAFELFMAEQAAAATAAEVATAAEAAAVAEAAAAAAATAVTAGEIAGLGATATEGIMAADTAAQAAMAADAAAGGAGAGQAGINAAQVAAQQDAAMQLANASNAGISGVPQVQTFPVEGFQPDPLSRGLAEPSLAAQPQNASFLNAPMQQLPQSPLSQYNLNAPSGGQGLRMGSAGLEGINAPTTPMTSVLQPPSALEAGMDKAIKFAQKNPFTAMTGAYMGASALGLLDPSGATFNDKPYDGPLSKYRLAPEFKSTNVNPANYQYTPRYATGGGIMDTMPQPVNQPYDIRVGYDSGGDVQGYAKGGSLSESISAYQKMLAGQPQGAPAASRDVGIYYDQDPDTRYQDALTAAQIRQAKINQRAYVSPPAAKRPMPMGKLNLPTSGKSKGGDDVEAAAGGIMHSSLGGYAAGGNPRLLKGPGDGMSDNIPATINGRQPARLADGEFVIPADVVSHLGNGSTEAGAKQLHAMMNKVRKARTGNPKQGKQIKPHKYMPK
jgi:hypothetical protein